MREILFRAKTADENEWIYGDIFHSGAYPKIMRIHDYKNRMNYAVNPETLGQFTGQYDANKKKIYEGDIIQYDGDYDGIDRFTRSFSEKAIVLWDEDYCGFVCKVIGDESGDSYSWLEYRENPDLTIIGNIHDNPELLGGAK